MNELENLKELPQKIFPEMQHPIICLPLLFWLPSGASLEKPERLSLFTLLTDRGKAASRAHPPDTKVGVESSFLQRLHHFITVSDGVVKSVITKASQIVEKAILKAMLKPIE